MTDFYQSSTPSPSIEAFPSPESAANGQDKSPSHLQQPQQLQPLQHNFLFQQQQPVFHPQQFYKPEVTSSLPGASDCSSPVKAQIKFPTSPSLPSQSQSTSSLYANSTALAPGQTSVLYGPASFQNGGAIMVPPMESGEPSLLNPKQSKQQEVLMLADLGQLPLPAMEGWDSKQKMLWLKCMLTKHMHQPRPEELPERVQKLRMVEACIRAQPNVPLESYISIFGQIFDHRIAQKLQYELDAWRQVCDSIPVKIAHASYLAASPEKAAGDHLWEHILRLLMNEDPTVEWLAINEGLFKFVDSSGAARSWGMTKGNMNMSYEKMSRSIRQYYTDDKNGLIQKATEYPKLHYRFNMFHPEVVSFLKKYFLEACQRHAFLATVVTSPY